MSANVTNRDVRPEHAAPSNAASYYDDQEARRYSDANVAIQSDLTLKALQLLDVKVKTRAFLSAS